MLPGLIVGVDIQPHPCLELKCISSRLMPFTLATSQDFILISSNFHKIKVTKQSLLVLASFIPKCQNTFNTISTVEIISSQLVSDSLFQLRKYVGRSSTWSFCCLFYHYIYIKRIISPVQFMIFNMHIDLKVNTFAQLLYVLVSMNMHKSFCIHFYIRKMPYSMFCLILVDNCP